MGNSNILRSKFGCEDISRQQYMGRRSKVWNYHQNYLYQTQIEQVGDQKLKVITYQINTSDRHYETYFQRLNMMSKYLTKGNIQLPLLCISENKEECSCSPENNQIVKFYYESYDVVLMEEIKARNKWREQFSEKQIWYILYNVANGLRQFETFLQPSGNLTPQDVLMNSQGEVKIKTALTSPFEEHRTSVLVNCFSPEELQIMTTVYGQEGLLTRNIYKQYQINPNICQVYSLAVTMLCLLSGRHHVAFYKPPLSLNKSLISECLHNLESQGYSKLLVNLLKTMLTSYQNRPLPSQIYQIFKQFEYQILHFLPFSFSLASSEVRSVY